MKGALASSSQESSGVSLPHLTGKDIYDLVMAGKPTPLDRMMLEHDAFMTRMAEKYG